MENNVNWTSWAVVTGVGLAGWAYYNGYLQRLPASLNTAPIEPFSTTSSSTPTGGRRKQRLQEGKAKKKESNKSKAESVPSVDKPSRSEDKDSMEEDKDSIRRLANAQSGYSISAQTKKESANRTVKQSAANAAPKAVAAPVEQDEPESKTTPIGNDVSDMLEKAAPSPSVLRVTESTKPQTQKKVQPKAAAQPQETKKQRQNRKKIEEKKAQREEEEKARKVLEEQQRRNAREARGEPAKNGVQPAKAPANNAWSEPASSALNRGSANGNGASELLDTYEEETKPSSAAPATVTAGMDASWVKVNTPEDEQMRMAEADSAWNTVQTKKSKKKAAPSVSEEGGSEQGDGAVKAVEASTKAPESRVFENKAIDTDKFMSKNLYAGLPEAEEKW